MLLDGECVSNGTPECPPGQTFSGQQCVHNGTPACAAGYKLVGGQCLDTKAAGCPPGYVDQNGICISTETPECDEGTTFDGKACVGEKPICPPGTKFDDQDCASINDPECPPGLKFNGRKCITEEDPKCPDGQELNQQTKECELEEGPRCPPGQKYNGEHCILGSTDCLEYEFCPPKAPGLLQEIPVCPANDGTILYSGSETKTPFKVHCDTCYFSPAELINSVSNLDSIDACVQACADSSETVGCNWFAETGECRIHPYSTEGLGSLKECTALERIR
jgi:hypothetical protein